MTLLEIDPRLGVTKIRLERNREGDLMISLLDVCEWLSASPDTAALAEHLQSIAFRAIEQ